ncbi:hypothetical protein [Endozoicomonas atrinae]|uniref:hypothetical protein n=1 Tax=Endozoicomonas atrinae TaxID=1333660 RepID=UPI003B0021CB
MLIKSHEILQKSYHGLSFLFCHLPRSEKWFHALVMSWVIWQLATSLGMHIHGNTLSPQFTTIDKLHIYGGAALFLPAVIFFVIAIHRRQVADLYPWLKGNLSQLKEDVETLVSLKLPEASPGGLAATIEGLGLLALLLAVITGLLWFITITFISPTAPTLLEIHKTSVGAIEWYFYGHGSFALLHLLSWWRG